MRAGIALVASLWASLVGSPAVGDWLVTRDGDRIETRGPWRVEGGRVLFQPPRGALSSLRLEDVDLEASREATAPPGRPAERAAAPAASTRRPAGRSVLVLTDADVSHRVPWPAGEAPADPQPPEPAASGDGPARDADAGDVRVVSWDMVRVPELDGVEIMGEVENPGAPVVGDVGVTVEIFGAAGGSLGRVAATVETKTLARGERSRFRALFREVGEVAVVDVVPSAVRFAGDLVGGSGTGGGSF